LVNIIELDNRMDSVRYLDKNITTQLNNMNCPNIVFRNIFLYCPHTTRPEIPNLQEDLYKSILMLGNSKRPKISDGLELLFNIFGSYKKVADFINLIYKDKEFRHEIFNIPLENRILTYGKYVHFRHNLLRSGIINKCI